MTKMPPLNKPSSHFGETHNTNKKSYEPVNWDLFFDELTYLDDVLFYSFRELPFSEQEVKAHYISVFTEQVTQH